MRLLIVIPTKDGGEGFQELLTSISLNLSRLNKKIDNLSYEIIFAINGDPEKPINFLNLTKTNLDFKYKIYDKPGKVYAVQETIKNADYDFLISLDDDIKFSEDLFLKSISLMNREKNIKVVGAKNICRPTTTKNFFKKFVYDSINIGLLKEIYKNDSLFLFGRFMVLRKGVYNISTDVLLEDLFLNMIYINHIKIINEKVYYYGVDSILGYIRRVVMLETGRAQIKNRFPEEYAYLRKRNKRFVNKNRMKELSLYYKTCFISYKILQFFTNNIMAKILKHKTIYW
jgi:hypothetical protein